MLQCVSNRCTCFKTDPGNILQVGDRAKLRISNDTTDYMMIGTKDVDDTNNTAPRRGAARLQTG